MNNEAMLEKLRAKTDSIRQQFLSGDLSQEELGNQLRRIGHLDRILRMRIIPEGSTDRLCEMLSEARNHMSKMIAIDCEFHDDSKQAAWLTHSLFEFGYTVKNPVKLKTHTYVVDRLQSKRTVEKNRYGKRILDTEENIKTLARKLYDESSMLILYSGGADKKALGLPPNPKKDKFVFDLSMFFYIISPHSGPSLNDLRLFFGITTFHSHEAGNDSRHTMEIALKILALETREDVAEFQERFHKFHKRIAIKKLWKHITRTTRRKRNWILNKQKNMAA